MTAPVRHTDGDVAELYCDIRDRLLALPRLTWWQRLLDWWAPSAAVQRRLDAIEAAYRDWQERHRPARDKVQPLPGLGLSPATAMALNMVRSQRRGEDYAERKTIAIRNTDLTGQGS